MIQVYAGNFDHLKDDLVRLDLMIQRAVRRIQSPRKGNELPGLYISDKEVNALLASGIQEGGNTMSTNEGALLHGIQQQTESITQRISESVKKGVQLQFPWLARTFGLSPFEMDALLVCLAHVLLSETTVAWI